MSINLEDLQCKLKKGYEDLYWLTDFLYPVGESTDWAGTIARYVRGRIWDIGEQLEFIEMDIYKHISPIGENHQVEQSSKLPIGNLLAQETSNNEPLETTMTSTSGLTTTSQVRKISNGFWGSAMLEIDCKEYGVVPQEQAEVIARQIARECLDQVRPELIIKYSQLPPEAINLVRRVQEDGFPNVQLLTEVITDLDGLVDEAVATDGVIHFIGRKENGPVVLFFENFPASYKELILRECGLPLNYAGQVYLFPCY